jgi:hypothetical protein
MRNWLVLFLLAALAGAWDSSISAQPDIGRYRYHQDFALTETAGVFRSGEPVRFRLTAAADSLKPGALLLWDRTNSRRVPVQVTGRMDNGVEILFVVNQPAHSTVNYRLYYGSQEPDSASSEKIKVSGEDLAWQVENEHLIVDFKRNPGTGRSGQINRIFAKRPGIWLSRERDQSTLHLSPNAAGHEHYLPVNRWDPPEKWSCKVGEVGFQLERSGPMPRLPELQARVVYEIYAGSRLILIDEEIEASKAVDLTLLRLGEFTFAPDPRNPFTNLVWGNGGQAFEAGRGEKPEMPVDVAWLGFIRRPGNCGFISVLDRLETVGPAGDPALMMNPIARFSGDPAHYFWRALITNDSGERGPAISLPAGSRYRLRHWVYWLEPGSGDPLEAMSDVWKAIKSPLRVRLLASGSNRPDDQPFGVRRQKEPGGRADSALRALQWLGRDFSFLVPGEDGATLRAAARALEPAENQAGSAKISEVLAQVEAVLRKHSSAKPIGLSVLEPTTVPEIVPLHLGGGSGPVVLEFNYPALGSRIASGEVSLARGSSQIEEMSVAPAGRIWLVLRVSGRPEGGESKRLRLRIGEATADLLLRSDETPLSTIRVFFDDAATDRQTPVAVRLYDAEGRLVLPPGVLNFGKLGYLYEEGRPVHYADWSSACVRSLDPHFGSSFFRSRPVPESACFYVDGELATRLPPGTYRLTATRGVEYKPSGLVMNVLPGKPFQTRVRMERWTDMRALGWYSGDGHVHAERASSEIDDLIATWAAAEDLAFSNVLMMGDEERTYYGQYAYGPRGRCFRRGTVLAPGQEDPRTAELGHTLHLNIQSPVRFQNRYSDYPDVFSETRRQGALAGFAHVGRRHWSFHAERGLTLLAPLGLVDFVEVAQMGYIGIRRWFDFLNLGFRLTAMAGSDVPWGGTIGNTRVYAYTGTAFTPEAWLEAVWQGRTFVTTGPMLDLTVNGERPGSLLRLNRGQSIRVSARAWGWGPHVPETIELIVSGETVHRERRREDRESVTADTELAASRGVWVTALARTAAEGGTETPGFFEGAVATPVYVQVGGESWVDRRSAAALVTERLKNLAEIEEWLGQDCTESMRQAIEQARQYYRLLLWPDSPAPESGAGLAGSPGQ